MQIFAKNATVHNAALLNAQKVQRLSFISHPILISAQAINLNPSSYRGYQLEHEVFHGAQRYGEAIAAFEIMLSKLENAPNTHIRSEP